MRIGIDFDNTIANYDGVFYRAAMERGLIPDTLGTGKNAVRDYLNGSGQKDAFTELQGYVYGARMDLAQPYNGVEAFVAKALMQGHTLYVVSHKTRHPILGPQYDMHEAARGFLRDRGLSGPAAIPADQVFFELTRDEKADRAAALGVEVFIDDLPEVLDMPQYGAATRILFAPHDEVSSGRHIVARSWSDIATRLLGA